MPAGRLGFPDVSRDDEAREAWALAMPAGRLGFPDATRIIGWGSIGELAMPAGRLRFPDTACPCTPWSRKPTSNACGEASFPRRVGVPRWWLRQLAMPAGRL